MTTDTVYIGYNLEDKTFRNEEGEYLPESYVRKLWNDCKLDATMMVQRLITQFDWNGEALEQFYKDNK